MNNITFEYEHVPSKEDKQKWLTLDDEECVHVVPDFDSKPHGFPKGKGKAVLSDMDCPCKPKIDFSGSKPIIVHNSFIDQEAIEKSMIPNLLN